MKTKKMNLNKLRLKSFVTEYNANKTNTMKGGTGPATIDTACTSHVGQNSVCTCPIH
ncbi:MAG: pinensin family lanthipeptide [Bacteroidota bacterium]